MKFFSKIQALTILLVALFSIIGCGTKLGRDFEKQVDLTTQGITNAPDNLIDKVKSTCTDIPKVSEDADEELRLVSSEEQTLFIVDGKEMGRAKQLKVCINSKGEHTIVAQPPNCEEKIEKTKPPYDYPLYEFRFMLGECRNKDATPSSSNIDATSPKKNVKIKKSKRKSKRK